MSARRPKHWERPVEATLRARGLVPVGRLFGIDRADTDPEGIPSHFRGTHTVLTLLGLPYEIAGTRTAAGRHELWVTRDVHSTLETLHVARGITHMHLPELVRYFGAAPGLLERFDAARRLGAGTETLYEILGDLEYGRSASLELALSEIRRAG